jgi:lipopolysaccharide export system permease protein
MNSFYFFYIAKRYSKNFILIVLGITVAVAFVDYLQTHSQIVGSWNQKILYFFYTWEFRLTQFYPLSMVFAATITYMSLVQENILVSLFSFGYSKKQLFIPFVLPAFLFYIVMIYLQTGEFAYARERAWSIKHNMQSTRAVDELFFKYNGNFVYVEHLDPVQKIIHGVTVFELKNGKTKRAIMFDSAEFDGKFWIAKRATIMTKKYSNTGALIGFDRENVGKYKLLRNYKPKVIELIYEGESLSLIDAINTYTLLEEQGLNSSKIKATFYNKTLLPLFAFVVMAMIFFKTSYYARYMNRELVWALSLGGTLVVWGLFYALYTLGSSGSISPDIAVLLPIIIFILYGYYLYVRGEEKLV